MKDRKPAKRQAVIYARVSSEEQRREGYSLQEQIGKLREYAKRHGMPVVEEIVTAESAKKPGRKDFGRMVALVKANPGMALIVRDTDRSTRNIADYVVLDDLINKHGLEIHAVEENAVLNKNSSSDEMFMWGIRVLMARKYIQTMSEKVSGGMATKAELGYYPSRAPIGYLNASAGDRNIIVVDPIRGPLIAQAFALYATGTYSVKELAAKMMEEGLTTREGRRIYQSAFHKTLTNPVYTGSFSWNGKEYAGHHEALISTALYKRVQAVMAGRIHGNGYGAKNFAYRGLLTCGYCGCAITAEVKKGRYIYYHCTGRRGECARPYIREEAITRHFTEMLEMLVLPDPIKERLAELLRSSFDDQQEFQRQQVKGARKEEERQSTLLRQLYLDKLAGNLGDQTYHELRQMAESARLDAQKRLRDLEAAERSYFVEGLVMLELCQGAAFEFPEADEEDRRDLLGKLCSNSLIFEDRIETRFKKPFDLLYRRAKEFELCRMADREEESWNLSEIVAEFREAVLVA